MSETPPVNEGDEFQATIECVGAKGDGIAKVDGYSIFVPGSKQGDSITIKITRVLPNFAFAEII